MPRCGAPQFVKIAQEKDRLPRYTQTSNHQGLEIAETLRGMLPEPALRGGDG